MVPWIAGGGGGGGGGAPVHAYGSPNMKGANTNRTLSFHQHDYSGGPNDPGVFGSWLLSC